MKKTTRRRRKEPRFLHKKTRRTEAENDAILTYALEMVKSVPYDVSLRWVFYRLLQEGYYSKKGDVRKWGRLCINARHSGRCGWKPDTLIDDTRGKIYRVYGARDYEGALGDLIDDVRRAVNFELNHFYEQDNYVELWFEAKAMAGQFRHYTQRINLVPFGGDPSIPLKWDLAKDLEYYANKYDKPIVILYFGDLDDKGKKIPKSAGGTVSEWCSVDFQLVHCGLTKEQAEANHLPENPDKPGEYQWEALSDEAAREIITQAVSQYIDVDVIDKVNEETAALEEEWKDKISEAIQHLIQESPGQETP